MRLAWLVILCMLGLAVATVLWLTRSPDRDSTRSDTEKPVVRTPPTTAPERPILIGRPMPPPPKGPSPETRRVLQAQTEAFDRAVTLHEVGRLSDHDLGLAQMGLLEARWAAGEIDERALHAGRAELFAADLQRLEGAFEAGVVPQLDVERGRLHVAFEEHGAGQPPEDYLRTRAAYKTWLTEHFETLIGVGHVSPAERDAALRELDSTFPLPR